MAMVGLAVRATQPSQRKLIQIFIFREHVMNSLYSSAIFGQISVGPNCGTEPHLSRWFWQHSNTKGVSGISERHADPLPPRGVVGGRCDAYWACFVPQSPCRCPGRWLEFRLEKVNKVSVVSREKPRHKEKMHSSGDSEEQSVPFLECKRHSKHFPEISFIIAQGYVNLETFTYYIKPCSGNQLRLWAWNGKLNMRLNKILETIKKYLLSFWIEACKMYIIQYHWASLPVLPRQIFM